MVGNNKVGYKSGMAMRQRERQENTNREKLEIRGKNKNSDLVRRRCLTIANDRK